MTGARCIIATRYGPGGIEIETPRVSPTCPGCFYCRPVGGEARAANPHDPPPLDEGGEP